MHTEPWEWTNNLKQKFPQYFTEKKVLEVGSLDINGSVRGFFTDCEYVGLDLGEGKGVDLVQPVHEHIGEYDVVISTEMLEHDNYWKESLKAMHNNLKSGGIFILTCAGPDRQEHGTKRTTPQDAPFTTDYYRNISIEDFLTIIDVVDDYSLSEITYKRGKADLLFWGIKK
jgi:SAM-dependent methyltransferase